MKAVYFISHITDTYEPTITRGCPADMSGVTEPGQPYATLSWLIPQAEDYSPANIKTELIASPLLPPYNLVSSVGPLPVKPILAKCKSTFLPQCLSRFEFEME